VLSTLFQNMDACYVLCACHLLRMCSFCSRVSICVYMCVHTESTPRQKTLVQTAYTERIPEKRITRRLLQTFTDTCQDEVPLSPPPSSLRTQAHACTLIDFLSQSLMHAHANALACPPLAGSQFRPCAFAEICSTQVNTALAGVLKSDATSLRLVRAAPNQEIWRDRLRV
jgi:hypothetical protein